MHKRSLIHWAWIILAVCFVDLFVNYSIRLGYGVILPEMIRTLDFSRTAGGSIYNSYLFTYIILTPFTGYLTDRFGARRVITVCACFLSLGVLLMGTVQNLGMACLFYAIAGLGATGMWTPVITLVQRWFAFHRRGLALGILSTGYGLGFATIGVAFPWIVHQFSWRFAWYFMGACALLMIAANGMLLKSDPESSGWRPWGEKNPSPVGAEAAVSSPKALRLSVFFKDSRFWLIGVSYLSMAYGLYGITTFMVDYAKYQLELPLARASLLATIHGTSQIAGVLTVMPLSDHWGRKKTIILSNSCIIIALSGILFAGNSWGLLCFFVAMLAIFYGVTFPIYGACAGDYFPREVMGTVIGAWTPFYGIGAISAHWVTGFLRDITGKYDLAFKINVVMALLGLLLIAFVKKMGRVDNPKKGVP
ncbi:nitrate/nitrite transporter [Thermodesulfobacteriota bacterium]